MRYRALRFIDFFRPGDEIPDGHYDAGTLAKMAAQGKVEAVDEPEAGLPVEPESVVAAPERRKVKAQGGRKSGL